MRKFLLMLLAFFMVGLFGSHFIYRKDTPAPAPTKTETLKCVRVKEVGADAQIIYKCEVPK